MRSHHFTTSPSSNATIKGATTYSILVIEHISLLVLVFIYGTFRFREPVCSGCWQACQTQKVHVPTDRQAGQINQAWLSYQLDRITVSIYCTY